MLTFIRTLFTKLHRSKEREDVSLELPGADLKFNHRLQLCVMFVYDPMMPDEAYTALERHLQQRGYFLQVMVASRNLTPPLNSIEKKA